MKIEKCPNHPEDDLTGEDFYWRGTTRDKDCKKCKSRKIRQKVSETKQHLKMFSA